MRVRQIYQQTFAKVASALYLLGVSLHLLRILGRLSPATLTFWTDWCVLTLGAYCGSGFVMFSSQARPAGRIKGILYRVITIHLLGSSLLHLYILLVHSHEVMLMFPMWYSYFFIVVMGYFSVYSFNLKTGHQSSAAAAN